MVFVKRSYKRQSDFLFAFPVNFRFVVLLRNLEMASSGSASNNYLGKESLFIEVFRVLDVFLLANENEWRSTEDERPEILFLHSDVVLVIRLNTRFILPFLFGCNRTK